MEPIYFDYNATTPLAPEVLEAMLPFMTGITGNASSTHRFGTEARYAIERARREVEQLIGAPRDSIIFTGCGSESDVMALRGLALEARDAGLGNHLVVGAAEHKAVLDVARDLAEHDGINVTYACCDQWGRITPELLAKSLRPDTGVVAVMLANNELGTIQPIRELVEVTRERAPHARFHCDAIQGVGKVPISVRDLGVDTLAIGAHKFYGPKGVGALYIRPGVPMRRLIGGGGQERGLRSGTENTPGIVGLATALRLAVGSMAAETARLTAMREQLWQRLHEAVPELIRNSPSEDCLPGTLHVSEPGCDGRALVRLLDAQGIAVSSGSACSSTGETISHVLEATGAARERARGSVRISLGRWTLPAHLDRFVEAFATVAASARPAVEPVPH